MFIRWLVAYGYGVEGIKIENCIDCLFGDCLDLGFGLAFRFGVGGS